MPDLDLPALRRKAEAATPGPWAYEGVSEKSNDYRVGIACPVLPNGDVGPAISGNVKNHPHYFNNDTNEFGEWYCEEVAMLDETSHTSDGGCGSDAAYIAAFDPPTVLALITSAERLAEARRLVNEQAEDERLWFKAEYITEDTLQKALRALHAVIEGVSPDDAARAFLANASPTQDVEKPDA